MNRALGYGPGSRGLNPLRSTNAPVVKLVNTLGLKLNSHLALQVRLLSGAQFFLKKACMFKKELLL